MNNLRYMQFEYVLEIEKCADYQFEEKAIGKSKRL